MVEETNAMIVLFGSFTLSIKISEASDVGHV